MLPGHFGFSVQKKIWLEVGGKGDWETECKLDDRVGWRKGGSWLNYSDQTFNKAAPPGHLPFPFFRGRLGWGLQLEFGELGYLFSRIKSCKL